MNYMQSSTKTSTKKPDLKVGMTVRVHQTIKDVNAKGEEKERVQVFEGIIIGIALYYYSYSSWKGKKFFLEDLIVTQAERGRKVGEALFDRCLELAKEQGYNFMVWQVSEWNDPAINFYKKYGTEFSTEWLDCSVEIK